jgi:hypothetical protein
LCLCARTADEEEHAGQCEQLGEIHERNLIDSAAGANLRTRAE